MENLPEKIQTLFRKSDEAKSRAHCPYSNFRVGAAILAEDGTIIQGCNVENASYTLGICAERCAIFKAISDGYTKFKAIAISTDVAEMYSAPCGACRQIMYEFGADMDVYMTKPDHTFLKKTPRDIVPHAFGPEELKMMKVNTVTNGTSNGATNETNGTTQ